MVALVCWTLIPDWEWSFLDDAGQKTYALGYRTHRGLLGGVWANAKAQYDADIHQWGLFRPLWYPYASTFYLLSPAIAHALRFAMVLVVVVLPPLWLSRPREGRSRNVSLAVVGICLLGANTTLYQGLSFLSLQELSGLALVSLGLCTDRRVPRSLLWLGAAWFKSPFVWLLLLWSLWLLLSKRRVHGALVLLGATATLILAGISARHGAYTASFGYHGVHQLVTTGRTAQSLFYWPGTIGVLGLLVLRPRPSSIRWREPLPCVLTLGGVLYLANLLPSNADIGAYYGSPIIWMVSTAALALLATSSPIAVGSRPLAWVSLAVAAVTVATAGYVVGKVNRLQLERNAAVVGLRDFVLQQPNQGQTYAINGPEAAERLGQVIRLHDPQWTGRIEFLPANSTERPDFYFTIADQANLNTSLMSHPVRRFAKAAVYEP